MIAFSQELLHFYQTYSSVNKKDFLLYLTIYLGFNMTRL